MPPEKPASNGKAAPGDTKKAGKVVFGGGNRLLAAKVQGLGSAMDAGALIDEACAPSG